MAKGFRLVHDVPLLWENCAVQLLVSKMSAFSWSVLGSLIVLVCPDVGTTVLRKMTGAAAARESDGSTGGDEMPAAGCVTFAVAGVGPASGRRALSARANASSRAVGARRAAGVNPLTVPSDGTTPEVAICPLAEDSVAVADDVALGAYRNTATTAAVVVKVRNLTCRVGRPLPSHRAWLVEDLGARMELPFFVKAAW